MESRILFICAVSYFVQTAFTHPHNLGHSNFVNGYTSNHQNIHSYPNHINAASNSLAFNQFPRNAAASSLATANVGQNNLALLNTNLKVPSSYGNAYLHNNAISNNAASGFSNTNLYNNLGSNRLNANSLAHNVFGNGLAANIGSLGTSGATAQSLARNIVGSGNSFSNLAVNKAASNAGAYSGASLGGVSEFEVEDVDIECPDNREIIGYVSFEGYLPVAGSVKVAESTCE